MRVVIAFFIGSLVLAAATEDAAQEAPSGSPELAEEENLMTVVKSLKNLSKDTRYHSHGQNIAYHANLLQSKAEKKAYRHGLAATSAIKAAIRALTSELTNGHNHDKNALKTAKNAGNNSINSANNRGKTTCAGFRNKACPTKKREHDADNKKKAAKAAQGAIKKTKVCPISTTWKDMGVKNTTPRFGTVLRNSWDKKRALWLKRTSEYNAAKRAHAKAINTHTVAMAEFKTALRIQADAASAACKNAHKEYNVLVRDVKSNVGMRKQVYIATLVITCYVDNVKSNSAAKACADKQRRASTAMWNIKFPSVNSCHSSAVLQARFGPVNWQPTKKNCKGKGW